jgi:two-component system response regulator RegA
MAVAYGHLLVADDDRVLAGALRDRLAASYREITLADSASAVMAALEQVEPEVLIIEPGLPGRSWHALLTSVRAALPHTRIIIVSGFGSRALGRLAADLGIVDFWTKPIALDALVTTLRAGPAAAGELAVRPAEPSNDRASLARLEWEYINATILECEGNMAAASRRLALPRQTIYRKLRKHPPPR